MASVTGDSGLHFSADIDENPFERALTKINNQLLATYEKQKREAEIAVKQQKEYANLILATGSAFKSLDKTVQSQLQSLAALNTRYRQVSDARKNLDDRYANGVIGVEAYNQALAQLMAEERGLSSSIEKVTSQLSANDKVMQAANGSIIQKMALLEQLKQKYLSLSEADRNNIAVTSPIINNIRTIDAEIKAVQNSFAAVEQHAIGSINERAQALAKLKNDYQALSAADRETDLGRGMLENIIAVEAEVQKLNNSLSGAGRNALGSINAKAAELAKLKADYSALSETDRNSDIGKGLLTSLHAADAEMQQINRSFQAIQQNAAGSINEKVQALQRLREQYNALSATDRTGNIGKGMLQNIKELDREVKQLNTDFSQTNSIASQVAVAIGGYLSLQGATQLIGQIVKVRGEFEQLEVTFRVLLQSKEKADKLLAEATQLAATTPFSLRDVAAGAKQLLAYGFSADTVTNDLKMLGNVAAATGQPLGDLVYLYGTLKTQGRAYTQDIRQFTGRGIPIIAELAKQFGVTNQQVQELVESGQVGFPQIEKAFQKMTGAGGQFFNLMQEQSKTVTGQISNLGDAFDVMLNNIGKSNEGIIVNSIAGLKTLVENYQTVIDILEVLAVTYGAYKAAVIAQTAYTAAAATATQFFSVAVKELTISETLYGGATLIAERATASLNKTMLANPYIAVATLIAALAVTLYELRDTTNAVQRATAELTAEEEKATQRREELKNKTQELVGIIQSETSTRFAQVEAFEKLQKLYPAYLGKLDLQGFKTISAKDAQLEFNKALDEANLQRKEQEYEALIKKIRELEGALKGAQGDGLLGQSIAGKKYQSDLDTAREKIKFLKKDIDDQKEAQFEQNAAPAELVKHYQDAIVALQKQRKEITDTTSAASKAGYEFIGWKNTIGSITLSGLDSQIEAITKKLKGLIPKSSQDNRADIDASDSIDKLNTVRTRINDDYNKEQDAKRREQLAKDLEYADKRKKILDVYGADKTIAKQQESIENKINEILNQRTNILDKIMNLQRDSKQSGLLQDQSEIDKIREKYDAAFKAIDEYNAKVAVFNKKNGTKVQGIGLNDVDKLTQARQTEIDNTTYKQDAAAYIASLDDKKKAFDDFQKLQEEGNTEVLAFAREKYREQLGDFNTYLDYLKNQSSVIQIQLAFNPDNIGLQQALIAVNKQIVETQNKLAADATAQQIKEFSEALAASATYDSKRRQINDKFERERQILVKNFSGKELQERLKVLDQGKQAAIDAAKDEVFQKTALYQKLNEDIIELTKKQVRQEIEAIQAVLSKGANIPDDLKKQLQDKLASLQGSLNFSSRQNYIKGLEEQKKNIEDALATGKLSTEEFIKQEQHLKQINQELDHAKKTNDQLAATLQKVSSQIGDIAGAFGNLASAIAPFDEGLSATLETVSDIGNVLGSAAGAAASFASGDIVGGISKTISTIASVFTIGAKSRESERKANEELKKYQDDLIKSGITYNETMRERLRTQQDISKLTIEELHTRQQLLITQQQQAKADYARLLAQVQAGKQVTGESTEKYGGILGIGRKTRTVQELAGLSGADYDQLEQLFTEGKLDEKTAQWFQELQKAHDELDAIGESSQDVADRLNEILTGTTSDNIASSITDGLEKGYDSFADFSDDINSLLRKAIISAFSAQVVGPAAKSLYDQLAAFNSDGTFTQSEIDEFKRISQSTIEGITNQFDAVKQSLSGLDFANDTGSGNSLQGAIKGITEQTAELLAGQLGGVRLNTAALQQIATQQLNQLNQIQVNTSYILSVDSRLADLQNRGIKVR